MRRKIRKPNFLKPDLRYNSDQVEKFINSVMYDGKKNLARRVVYQALDIIKEKNKSADPTEVFFNAIRNAGPSMEVRSRRVGGANYQVPREVRPERKLALAIRWIIGAARGKKGKPMHVKLADELMAAANNEGEAIKKRDNTLKMAEANKAFAHFAW